MHFFFLPASVFHCKKFCC